MRNALLALSLCLAPALTWAQTSLDAHASDVLAFASPIAETTQRRSDEFSPDELALVRQRLREMDCIIAVRDHPIVESYLRGYILRNRAKSQLILGRVPAYFPLFEAELRKAGLPDDLKYLAIVESALVPKALSRSGAGGLWQFMPGTGAQFGLQMNADLDQRGDPQLSTEAAVAYLRDEYARFADWSLVLAAYNGGPGRVKRAVDKVGANDFWKIHPLLPKETRNYVPAFVAAMYLHKYGHLHGLQPLAPQLDEQLPVSIACPSGINLTEVAQATQLSLDLVRALNPHCLRDYLPAGPRANCRVPARAAQDLEDYLLLRSHDPESPTIAEIRARPVLVGTDINYDHLYSQSNVFVAGGQSLSQVARDIGVSEHHLRVWNPSAAHYSLTDREIKVYSFGQNTISARPVLSGAPLVRVKKATPAAIALKAEVSELGQANGNLPNAIAQRAPNEQYVVKRYETLLDIWQRHASTMTWQEFSTWNAIDADSRPIAGQTLFIRS